MGLRGAEIECMHALHLARMYLCATIDPERYAGLHDPPAFAPDILALAGRHAGEEIIEVTVCTIMPVELYVMAYHQAVLPQQLSLV